MRSDIKMLCVTNWNDVLELRTEPKHEAGNLPGFRIGDLLFPNIVTVADPDAVDAGMIIGLDEIKLVARKKR